MYSRSVISEIQSNINLYEVISKSVSLQLHGKEYIGLCPFHNEKTPSFTVNNDKGFFHCFGCGEHGNVYDFICKTHGIDFKKAVEYLAPLAGVQLFVEPEISDRLRKMYHVMDDAASWFEFCLSKNKIAQKYLLDRGFDEEFAKKLRLGFAPNFGLTKFLCSKNVSVKLLCDLGLSRSNVNGSTYDYFRNRIIFPIINARNSVIAFGGRVLDKSMPKYLNSPESDIFIKSKTLYCAEKCHYDELFIVEGYVDVLALKKVGINNVVSLLGTAVTVSHIDKLFHISKNLIFCMDGDIAGKKAMRRIVNILLPALAVGCSIKFMTLPDKVDPDDVVKKEGKEGILRYAQKAIDLAEMIWLNCLSDIDCDFRLPEQYAILEKSLFEYVYKIKDELLSRHYKSFFRDHLYKLRTSFNKKSKNKSEKSDNYVLPSCSECDEDCKVLISIIMQFPELLNETGFEEQLANFVPKDEKLKKLISSLMHMFYENPEIFSVKRIKEYVNNTDFDMDVNKIFTNSWKYKILGISVARSLWRRIMDHDELLKLCFEYDKEISSGVCADSVMLDKRIKVLHDGISRVNKSIKFSISGT